MGGAPDKFAKRTHGKVATYSFGCRCDECREAWRAFAGSNTKQRAHRKARRDAATWMHDHHPEEYQALVDAALAEIKKESP